jgi:hypothetical protein
MFLEGSIVWRAFRTKLLSRYVFFYVYITAVWSSDVLLYIVYRFAHASYLKWNWPVTFFDVILSFGIVLEILEHEIPPHSCFGMLGKIGRVGRQLVGGAMVCLATACAFVIVSGSGKIDLTNIHISRDLAAVQAIFLVAVLGVIFYHAIPIGRNLLGMILGYGLCVGASLMILSLRIYIGPTFNPTWLFLQPAFFWLSLWIWLLTLWNDDGEPVFGWAVMKNETAPFSLAGKARTWMRSILSIPAQGARP